MRALPELIVAVVLGGLLLFGLLWLWFWFEDNLSWRRNGYPSQYRSGYSHQSENGYDGGDRHGYGDDYRAGQPIHSRPYRARRHVRRPCYDPCY